MKKRAPLATTVELIPNNVVEYPFELQERGELLTLVYHCQHPAHVATDQTTHRIADIVFSYAYSYDLKNKHIQMFLRMMIEANKSASALQTINKQ